MSLVVPPYPEPRYLDDEPEVSAWLKRAPENGGAPPDYETAGVKYHYLANQQATAGDYGLYRVDIASAAGGPGPHFHRAISEAFFVLSGTMKLYDGNDWVDGHQGDFLYVPPGGIHGFRNEADEPASILMLFAPGAPREAYFEGFAALADMTDDERRDWFIRHDNFWVQQHHRTGKPHGWIHNELRRICGGPRGAAATGDQLKARIEAARRLTA